MQAGLKPGTYTAESGRGASASESGGRECGSTLPARGKTPPGTTFEAQCESALRVHLGRPRARCGGQLPLGEKSGLSGPVFGVVKIAQTDADQAKALCWVESNTASQR